MKIRINRMGWIAGSAVVLALGGLGAAACSSDTATGTPNALPTPDSSVTTPGTDAGGGKDTGTPTPAGDSGTTPGMDGGTGTEGGACAKPPMLHPPKADAGLYCPYIAKVGTTFPTCTRGTETCCLNVPDGGPTTPPSTCEATCAPEQNPWQCQGPEDCVGAGKGVCCLAGTLVADLDCPGFEKAKAFKGTTCQASCPAGAFVACEAQKDCTTGTCTPIKATGQHIGVCK